MSDDPVAGETGGDGPRPLAPRFALGIIASDAIEHIREGGDERLRAELDFHEGRAGAYAEALLSSPSDRDISLDHAALLLVMAAVAFPGSITAIRDDRALLDRFAETRTIDSAALLDLVDQALEAAGDDEKTYLERLDPAQRADLEASISNLSAGRDETCNTEPARCSDDWDLHDEVAHISMDFAFDAPVPLRPDLTEPTLWPQIFPRRAGGIWESVSLDPPRWNLRGRRNGKTIMTAEITEVVDLDRFGRHRVTLDGTRVVQLSHNNEIEYRLLVYRLARPTDFVTIDSGFVQLRSAEVPPKDGGCTTASVYKVLRYGGSYSTAVAAMTQLACASWTDLADAAYGDRTERSRRPMADNVDPRLAKLIYDLEVLTEKQGREAAKKIGEIAASLGGKKYNCDWLVPSIGLVSSYYDYVADSVAAWRGFVDHVND